MAGSPSRELVVDALAKAGIIGQAEEDLLRIAKQEFRVIWRSAQPWQDRLLEILTLHGLRMNTVGKQNAEVMVIRVPRLPRAYAAVPDQLRSLIRNRTANWIVVSDRGGFDIHLTTLGINHARQDERFTSGIPRADKSGHGHSESLQGNVALTILKMMMSRQVKSARFQRW